MHAQPWGLGIDQFSELRQRDLLFVDKSMFIAEIIHDPSKVTLITRPRRFGKTLNLSMLSYFLDLKSPDTDLFDGLLIKQASEEIWQHYHSYPVIAWSLKDIQGMTTQEAYDSLALEISKLYQRFKEDLVEHLQPERQQTYTRLLNQEASKAEVLASLRDLSEDLYHIWGKRVWILIDEYDTPVHLAYTHGFHEDMLFWLRGLLSSALKGNPHLERGVITGILEVAKENLFSGLNHVMVYTVLSQSYSSYFGFTEKEVMTLMQHSQHTIEIDALRHWYNGYQMGKHRLYNPWSVLCYLKTGETKAHWVCTAQHALLSQLLAQSSPAVKTGFEALIAGQTLEVPLVEHVILPDLPHQAAYLWYFMLASGYLTLVGRSSSQVTLKIPNLEVTELFKEIITRWFGDPFSMHRLNDLLKAFLNGDQHIVQTELSKYFRESMSYFDVSGHEPERVYHAFVLGLMIALREGYHIRSNRESGYGRYDVMLIPKHPNQPGVIIEFKLALASETLEEALKRAHAQIRDKHYASELEQAGVSSIQCWAIAFQGKKVLASHASAN